MAIGGLSGYCGGRIDRWLMRICEVVMSFPFFFLMLALRAAIPPTFSSLETYLCIVVIMSFVAWPGLARVIRGMVLSIKERDFVVAMRCAGMPTSRIIRRYVLPQTYAYALVAAFLNIPAFILAEAGLSFLGLGIQEPFPSWGNMLQSAMNVRVLHMYPWMLLPGVALCLVVMALFMVSDQLQKKENV